MNSKKKPKKTIPKKLVHELKKKTKRTMHCCYSSSLSSFVNQKNLKRENKQTFQSLRIVNALGPWSMGLSTPP